MALREFYAKTRWLEEGLQILSEYAQDKIRIQVLCERLKLTKGSFYHHFHGIEDYIDQLLHFWKKKSTDALIQKSERIKYPQEKLFSLDTLTFQIDHKIEQAIRSWSYYNSSVKEILKQVDLKRIEYLASIYLQLGFQKEDAMNKAKLEYATFVGVQMLYADLNPNKLKKIFSEHLLQKDFFLSKKG